ncbi:ATPase, T2SS/T4P/T4SS family, partial [Pseudomonas syringae group genomosp. 7]|uniref:ATPase, T2SS/T4P/T4SS family n=1 Tax=Pseudomonas syringae group genomosp. 7 TaxID=251699 RepID=UPI00376FCA4B
YPRQGLDFSQSLRAFLRHYPEVIMVCVIRVLETAVIAINASQTGHMVLSTLHTIRAAETLSRLHHMGFSYFYISKAMILIFE